MSRSVNEVTLLGNLGKDAETKFTPSGVAKTTFTVATTRKWKQGEEWKEDTQWHNCVLWRSESLSNFLTKGKQVYVKGRIETRSYEKDGAKKYITEIVADNVILLGGGDQSSGQRSAPRKAEANPFMGGSADIDDVPFMRYEVPCL